MAFTTRILTQREIERLVDMRSVLRVVEQAFRAQARGTVRMPPKLYLTLPDGSDFRAMPAYLETPRAAGLKWVNVHPRNRAKGLPTVMGTVIINDPGTGAPLAVLDGLSITRLRTGAAGGVAAKALARRDTRTVGLVGCGAQAYYQLAALATVFRLQRVFVWGYHAGEARRFCRRVRPRLRIDLTPASTVQACVAKADLVVTITPSRQPLIRRAWLRPGTHLNAMGADAPGKQELDPAILREALVVVDDRPQALHGGELNVPISRGLVTPSIIHASLGEILLGRARGRRSPTELTVFDSTGLATHDVAVGQAILRQALRRRVGRTVRLFDVVSPDV